MPVDRIAAATAQVRCLRSGIEIACGSGFFYTHEDETFLITNRHVVIGEDYEPESLLLALHTDPNDLRKNTDHVVALYDKQGRPVWNEHPVHGEDVDVVSVPLDRAIRKFVIFWLNEKAHIPQDVDISIGEDVQVIGYPLGFHDKVHNLPIIRSASLASVYPVPFEGFQYVLIDSRLHGGTSGSPVMTKPSTTRLLRGGGVGQLASPVSYLVGVHSASIDMVSDGSSDEEPLGLNVVWFASLIPEIISGQT